MIPHRSSEQPPHHYDFIESFLHPTQTFSVCAHSAIPSFPAQPSVGASMGSTGDGMYYFVPTSHPISSAQAPRANSVPEASSFGALASQEFGSNGKWQQPWSQQSNLPPARCQNSVLGLLQSCQQAQHVAQIPSLFLQGTGQVAVRCSDISNDTSTAPCHGRRNPSRDTTTQELSALPEPHHPSASKRRSNPAKGYRQRGPKMSCPLPPSRSTAIAPSEHITPAITSPSFADGPSTSAPLNNRRRRLTIDETEYLLDYFHHNEKPNTKERQLVAQHLNLDQRTIQVWFQNRRAKLKRDDSLARVYFGEQEASLDGDCDQAMNQGKGRNGNNADDDCRAESLTGERQTSDYGDNDDRKGESARDGHYNGIKITSRPGDHPRSSIDTASPPRGTSLTDVSHRGSGTETFVGFERSDPGINDPWTPGTDLHPFFQQPVTSSHIANAALSTASLASTRASKGYIEDLQCEEEDCTTDYFDMGTLDTGYGLGLELLGVCSDTRPPDVLKEDRAMSSSSSLTFPLTEGTSTGSSSPSVTTSVAATAASDLSAGVTEAVGSKSIIRTRQSLPHPSAIQKDLIAQWLHIAGKKENGYPPRRQSPLAFRSSSSSSSSSPVMSLYSTSRRSAFLLCHENPVPRHQMALTLVPLTADASSSSEPQEL